jgi:2'-5' RNA ligase
MPKYARLFFGLPLAKHDQEVIANWVAPLKAQEGHWVPAENYHATIAFIGDHDRDEIPALIEFATPRISKRQFPFNWELTKTGHFKTGIFFLGGWNVPLEMSRLAHDLSFFVPASEHHRSFVPHITLARNAPNYSPETQVDFSLTLHELVLFESIQSADGIHYKPLHAWC